MHRTRIILKGARLWLSTLILTSVSVYFFSCGGGGGNEAPTIQGEWYQESSIDAGARSGAVTFTIDGKVYICSGFNGNGTKVFLRDLWVYEPDIDTWVKKKSLPDTVAARTGGVAFSANGKGYVGLGSDGTKYLKDFWSYDPATDKWAQIKDFAGAPREGAFAFSIADKGYVGTGNDENLHYKDFFQYDDVNDTWIQKPAVPKLERSYAFSFVLNDLGYVGGGTGSGSYIQDFYEFDPINNKWNEKNDLMDDKLDADTNDKGYTIAREEAVAFIIAGKAYVIGGKHLGSVNGENWEYTPETDTWIKKNAFEGFSRIRAIGFSLGDFGYIGTGLAGSTYLNDKWMYDPTQVDIN